MPPRQGGAEDSDGGVALTPFDFPEYAELWQEQTSPEELALLKARARTIARSARRRGLRDLALTFLCVATTGLFFWAHPEAPWIMVGFAPILAVILGLVWLRRRLTRAALAIAVDHPRAFFETAIDNVRAELRLSTIALVAGPLTFAIAAWGVKVVQGDHFGEWIRGKNIPVEPILALGFLLYLLFVRENRKLRAQLRRLEEMRREWEEQPGR